MARRLQTPCQQTAKLCGEISGPRLPLGVGQPAVNDKERRVGAENNIGHDAWIEVGADPIGCLLPHEILDDGLDGFADVAPADGCQFTVAQHLCGMHPETRRILAERRKVVANKIVQYLGQWALSGLLEERYGPRMPPMLMPACLDQCGLAGEVMVEKTLRDPHCARDVTDSCPLVAFFAEQADGGLQYLGTPLFGRLSALLGCSAQNINSC